MGCGSSTSRGRDNCVTRNDSVIEAYLAELRQEFLFQGTTENVEHRGITLGQLQRLVAFAETRCSLWEDTNVQSHTAGIRLHVGIINLYHICDWMIKPGTAERNCSFVELLTSQKQPPFWYVCHWWGERHVNFLKCVERHTAMRNFRGAYWICAYANRQHQLQHDIGEDPKHSGFFRAMELAHFKVLLIINESSSTHGPAIAFERIWCAFEISMCLQQASLPLDVANCHSSKAELVSAADLPAGRLLAGQLVDDPTCIRQQSWGKLPHEVVAAGLQVRLEKASASVPKDRLRILNSLVGRDLSLDPPLEEHPNYLETNKRLRSLFALSFWRHCLATTQRTPATERSGIWQKMREAARGDVWRKRLHMSLANCDSAADEDISFFLRSLPPNLQELALDLKHTNITDDLMSSVGTDIPESVEKLSLDLENCRHLSDAGVAALRRNLPRNLKDFQLELGSTQVSEDVKAACTNLQTFLEWEGDLRGWLNSLRSVSSRKLNHD